MSNHNTVAHNWANQTGRARTGFNMYYEGGTIYSYGSHFPIARIVRSLGARAYLMTSKSYSVSTAKHKSIVWRAMGYGTSGIPVFVVDDVNALSPQSHLHNHECMIRAAVSAVEKASRARKYASSHLDDAKKSVQMANDYAAFWDLGLPQVTLEGLNDAYKAIADRAEQMRAEAELTRAKAARERSLRDRENLRAWLQGAEVWPPHTRVPYVRVKGDHVETTWGADVPLADALKAWALMKDARATHMTHEWRGMRVGNFTVDRIDPIGMRVGCHFIPFKFAQLAARAAGLE